MRLTFAAADRMKDRRQSERASKRCIAAEGWYGRLAMRWWSSSRQDPSDISILHLAELVAVYVDLLAQYLPPR